MLRWLGAGLILCAALLTRRTLLEDTRRAQRLRRTLADALETMEAEIRLLLTPLPALLRRNRDGEAGEFFARVSGALTRGTALSEAWRRAANELPLPPGERGMLAELGARLGGSEESVCAALALAAETLRKRYDEVERSRPQTERLTTSVCLCAGLLVAILLI